MIYTKKDRSVIIHRAIIHLCDAQQEIGKIAYEDTEIKSYEILKTINKLILDVEQLLYETLQEN